MILQKKLIWFKNHLGISYCKKVVSVPMFSRKWIWTFFTTSIMNLPKEFLWKQIERSFYPFSYMDINICISEKFTCTLNYSGSNASYIDAKKCLTITWRSGLLAAACNWACPVHQTQLPRRDPWFHFLQRRASQNMLMTVILLWNV